jgi:hypothetical protein
MTGLAKFKRLAWMETWWISCLANYYAFEAHSDDPDGPYWILIAAENGTQLDDQYRLIYGQANARHARVWVARGSTLASEC